MIVGITATRHGLTPEQYYNVSCILHGNDIEEFHHGDCIGGDAEAHEIMLHGAKLGFGKIIIHPPVDNTHRAFCGTVDICTCWHRPEKHLDYKSAAIEPPFSYGTCIRAERCGCKGYVQRLGIVSSLPPKTYFARNRDIVHAVDILIGCPFSNHEEPKGGTWYTINYARKLKKWIAILWPDGRITTENNPL